MKDNSYEEYDDVLPEEPNAEVVHWMAPRPLTVGAAGLTLAVVSAFALGLATGLIAVGVSRLSGPERRMSPPLERKIRRLS
jgi:hypothetical protein